MAGAIGFGVLFVIGWLLIGTYLLQGALLLLQFSLWLGWRSLVACAFLACGLVFCVWWLFDRRGATAALRASVPARG